MPTSKDQSAVYIHTIVTIRRKTMIEAYYCTFLVYGLFGKQKFVTKAITLALELPIMGRIFGIW
jgi:hypothetical protein